jgi:hypothetical protein
MQLRQQLGLLHQLLKLDLNLKKPQLLQHLLEDLGPNSKWLLIDQIRRGCRGWPHLH